MTEWRRLTGSAPCWLALGLMILVLGAAACTASSAIAITTDLPNRSDQGQLHFRWALIREPAMVRAVGLAESPTRIVSWATVALFGVDREGRVVSRGQSDLRSGGFDRTSLPFEITLRPTGREERFELVLLHAQEGKPGD
jgi:hypothetical protein